MISRASLSLAVTRTCRSSTSCTLPAPALPNALKRSRNATPSECQRRKFVTSRQSHFDHSETFPKEEKLATSDVIGSLGAQPLKPLPEVDTKQHQPAPTQDHIEDLISSLPLIRYLRSPPTAETGSGPAYNESRLHSSMHPDARPVHLVSGSLIGPNKITVEPHHFCQVQPVHRIISTFYLGTHLCGHPGYIHGGLLVVLFDDIFGRCAGTVFQSGVGMTANLNTDFRKPSRTDRVYVARAEVVKLEGRKVWMTASIRCLNAYTVNEMKARPEALNDGLSVEEEEADLVAQASALFIEPKFANVRSAALS